MILHTAVDRPIMLSETDVQDCKGRCTVY